MEAGGKRNEVFGYRLRKQAGVMHHHFEWPYCLRIHPRPPSLARYWLFASLMDNVSRRTP